jgi:DNA-binding NarL/FixJ family response regulator
MIGYAKMSIPERRDAVAELIDEGNSNREIANVLGVDEKTVRNDAEKSAPEVKERRKTKAAAKAGAENSAPPPIAGVEKIDRGVTFGTARGASP